MSKRNLNRRLFLRGLGGASVAAPFLGSLTKRQAIAQTASESPKRLIVMFTHYGCMTDRWFPLTSHGALTKDSFTGLTLEALAPHAQKLLMPRGIRAMNEWTQGLSRGQGNDPHTQVVGSYFTCQPVTPNSDEPLSFDLEKKFNAKPLGPSLDHICARQISPSKTPLFMRVGGSSETPQGAISYSAAQEMFPGIGKPNQAFSLLTELFRNDQPMNADTYALLKGKHVLDLVKDDLETLERFDMSMSDQRKVEAWKDLVDTTIAGPVRAAQCDADVALALGLSEANVALASENGQLMGDAVAKKITSTLDAADIYSNVAALAAMCDANRVIFLKYPGNYVFRGLGLDTENHAISHRVGSADMGGECVPGVNDQILTIDRYYVEKFAHLVGTLDGLPEGEGSILDNSATVWFQEMSDGNAHNLNNLPIIQAGSCGGYFKTGQTINVADRDPNLSRGNSEGACKEPNSTIPRGQVGLTGTPAQYANAPINKYFCNLMNALGMKGDADGFPLEDGAGPITKFGRYDRTEDFIGGGTTAASITDPGEFEDLKT